MGNFLYRASAPLVNIFERERRLNISERCARVMFIGGTFGFTWVSVAFLEFLICGILICRVVRFFGYL